MRKQEFSCHLQKLTPELKKLINSMRRTRYFGWMDQDDLLQEARITLYMKVPKLYKKEKGSLKNYCLAAARNCLRRLANNQYKHQNEIGVDWSGVCEHSHGGDNNDCAHDIQAQAAKKIKVKPKTEGVLFRVKLDKLASINNDFRIVKTVYDHDSDRKEACKTLGISNASITKVFKRIRKHGTSFTVTSNPVKEYIENGVNAFAVPCINNNMQMNAR